jgi:hypothetical protein
MALLGACASNYVATPYAAGPEPIANVAVADDSVPENLSAWEAASIGSNFGLIGALVDAGVRSSRQDALSEALDTVSFDAEDTLERYMIDTLAAQGIQATLLNGPQRESRVFLPDYPDAPQGTQAYFDVVLSNYGYISAGHGDPWRPTADAMVRLVSVSDGRVLLENRIAYNTLNPPRGVITLAPNPQYLFGSREEMVSNPERLANGLKDALERIATTAVGLMR